MTQLTIYDFCKRPGGTSIQGVKKQSFPMCSVTAHYNGIFHGEHSEFQIGGQYTYSTTIKGAELIRRAVAEYLLQHRPEQDDLAFGIWKQRKENGLDYQNRLRKEWDE